MRPLIAFLFFAGSTSLAQGPPVDFQREVRPILSDNCFHCHGPDPNTRLAGLRLDEKDAALAARPNGAAIVPGDAEASQLYQRITASDARKMPPEYSHKKLEPEQIELLERWIEQGAPWSEHWSFVAPRRHAPPATKDADWVRNGIDAFILSNLEREGIRPAQEADRRSLIRRVSFDLTGLPPEPAEVEAFVNDKSPDAYEKLVDRLLDSEAWGEHRARYWLDAARYADTHGLHIDNYREMWPYRDWVIQAFNENMPFDQFTVEQIAGDLLPDPTPEQLIATGFHRCNITTNEGGVIDEEVAVMYAKDRVDTTGTVWLGLTVGCATCHDHKFDPIKQKDFYALSAFFRNTTQKPRDGNIYDTPPVMVVPSAEDRPRWEALRDDLPAAHERLDNARANAQKEIADWLDSRKRRKIEAGRFDASETYAIQWSRDPAIARDGKPLATERSGESTSSRGPNGLPTIELGHKGYVQAANARPAASGEPFTIAVRFRSDKEDMDGTQTLASQTLFGDDMDDDDSDRGWRFELVDGLPRLTMLSNRGQDFGMRVLGKQHEVEAGEWHHAVVTYDGLRQRDGISLYLDGEAMPTERTGRALRELAEEIAVDAPLVLGARATDSEDDEDGMTAHLQGAISDFRVFNRALTHSEAKLLSLWDAIQTSEGKRAGKLSDRERAAHAQYYLVERDRAFQQADRQLAALQAERRSILRRSPVTHIQEEDMESSPMAHILYRGMYDQRRDEVTPATPGVLPPMAADLPRNRLGLARWLVAEENPLTARVTVNRFWQEVFGEGLVPSAEDFGSQGEPPTHPELLDWLALEFRDSGWDVKALFRLMVTSSTYRQAAVTTPEKLEKDPDNRLLSRGPRFRMDGEMIRDMALDAGGLLARDIGGPSVRPYQPERIWETVAMKSSNTRFYEPDEGEGLYRRSLYTFWKRAAPPPNMMIFNAPTREECTVRRERTNTPLQALVTMNDPQFFEAARALAEDAMASGKELDDRLDAMTARLLARPFDERERSVARDAYRDYLRYYDSHPDDAAKAISVGESDPTDEADKVELAAWTMLANQLLNLDEALNK